MIIQGNEYCNRPNAVDEKDNLENQSSECRAEAFKELFADIRRLDIAAKKSERTYNLRRRAEEFFPHQPVWRRNYVLSDASKYFTKKLAPRYVGPFYIKERLSPWTYELEDGKGKSAGQHRLIPFLAAVYVIRNFNTYLSEVFYQFSIDRMMGVESEDSTEKGMEIHALSSASKPVVGWTMRDAIQECRETCGGHGYLKAAGIGDIRNDHDANLTYEGENHVLIQQCSNYLLKLWPQVLKRQVIASPLHSIDFITHGLDILSKKFNVSTVEEMCCPNKIIETYQWLITYLLRISYEKLDRQQKAGKIAFWAKNDSQVYYAKSLAIAYIQVSTV
nr:unnamed protein product [Callosobruchus analis]